MKEQLRQFIEGLILYDYVLFGASLFLFLLFVILAVIKRDNVKIALFFVLLAMVVVTLGPTYGYVKLHTTLFANKVELISQKRLQFVEAVVIKGKITNISKRNFSQCKITAQLYPVSRNKYKNYILKFKPFQKMSIVKEDIAVGVSKEFKMIVDPFHYPYKYGVSLKADCR